MDIEKTKKSLKASSILLIAIAICDVLGVALSLIGEDVRNVAAESGVSADILRVFTIIFFAYTAIVFIVEMYLGIAGLMQLNGKKGYIHITVATIVFVLVTIVFVISIISGIMTGFDWGGLAVDIAMLSVLFQYRKSAKELKEN